MPWTAACLLQNLENETAWYSAAPVVPRHVIAYVGAEHKPLSDAWQVESVIEFSGRKLYQIQLQSPFASS